MLHSACATYVCVVLVFLEATSALAVRTIDVGATAVDGMWRPTSCDDVKDGVVLTNVADNVRAVIEGCAITVEGSDTTKAAVSITGLGVSSTVELIGCTVTARCHHPECKAPCAVHVRPGAALGNGSKVLIHRSEVSVEETGGRGGAAAVMFDDGIVTGGGFQFQVAHSVLSAKGTTSCSGVVFSRASNFGHKTQFIFGNSTVAARASTREAFGVTMLSNVGDGSTVLMSKCRVSATAGPSSAFGLLFESGASGNGAVSITKCNVSATSTDLAHGITLRGHANAVAITGCHVVATAASLSATGVSLFQLSALSITDCNVSAAASAHAYGVRNTLSGFGASVSITRTTVSAAATSTDAYGVLYNTQRSDDLTKSMQVAASSIVSAAPSSSTALLLGSSETSASHLHSSRIVLSSSTLRFNGSSLSEKSAAIASTIRGALQSAQLTVAASSFVATGRAAAGSAFVRWPKTITGESPQSFDNVTFSGDGVAPFGIRERSDTTPGVTLCLHGVRWSNGTAISAGPPEFRLSDACVPASIGTWSMERLVPTMLGVRELASRAAHMGPSVSGIAAGVVGDWYGVAVAVAVLSVSVVFPLYVAPLHTDCATKEAEVGQLRTDCVAKEAEVSQLRHHCATKEAEVDQLRTDCATKEAEVSQLRIHCASKEAEIDRLRTGCITKEAEVEKLQNHCATMEAEVDQYCVAKEAEIAELRTEVTQHNELLSHAVVAACTPYCRLQRNSEQCNTEEGVQALQAARGALAASLVNITGQDLRWCDAAGVEAARAVVGGEEAAAVLLRTREREHAVAAAACDAEPNDENRGRADETQAVLLDARASHKMAANEAVEVRSLFPGLTAHVGGRGLAGATEAARAAAAGDAAQLELLIKRNPEVVSWPDTSGVPPLHAAARSGHEACVRLLLAYGADPHAVSSDGNLAVAAAATFPSVVTVLARAMAAVPRCGHASLESVARSSAVAPPTNIPADPCISHRPNEPYYTGAVAVETHRDDPLTRGLHSLYAGSGGWEPVPSNHTCTDCTDADTDVVPAGRSTE